MNPSKSKKPKMSYNTIVKSDVPRGRNGKHKAVVTRILKDLDVLQSGSALKVPLSELTDIKENIRSALNRATRKSGRQVATAADGEFLYIWNQRKEV
jgi:hypothetical protein